MKKGPPHLPMHSGKARTGRGNGHRLGLEYLIRYGAERAIIPTHPVHSHAGDLRNKISSPTVIH